MNFDRLSRMIVVSILGIAIIVATGFYVYWWMAGVYAGSEYLLGLGTIATTLIVVTLIFISPMIAGLSMSALGIAGLFMVFGWPWYGVLAMYALSIAFYVAIGFGTGLILFGAFALDSLSEMFKRR